MPALPLLCCPRSPSYNCINRFFNAIFSQSWVPCIGHNVSVVMSRERQFVSCPRSAWTWGKVGGCTQFSVTAVSHQNRQEAPLPLDWVYTVLLCVHLQRHLLAWWSAECRRYSCWCAHFRQMHPPSSGAQNYYTCDSPYAGTVQWVSIKP
jgi:hypothetical protein